MEIAKYCCPSCKIYLLRSYVQIAKADSREEEAFEYDEYAPEAAALHKVEILDPEEKTGPPLGRVLGALLKSL